MGQSSNVVWHQGSVNRGRREGLNGHKGQVIWFTGLSGAGKSTIAHAVEERLYEMGCRTYVLDGDNVRHGLCGDLSFSVEDRQENIRRVGEIAKLFVDAGVIVLTAFISPLRSDRERVRELVGEDFNEVYCACPISECERRDVKGMYQRARRGEIKEFTGISSPYEEPENPELTIDSSVLSVDDSVDAVLALLMKRGVIVKPEVESLRQA
ncbi:adenylyl-sulfate kinase [Thiohalomonas denitrificans]|uniref:Adenylyl-sulfate kinase n=1 Tax=Thiohalomonas denitrificans TaxID=415747 RepID=A0A1G5QZW9_9GAMM|nr:adenylyl-sulfate kinase [Thiohalomonas denitrificans]SCZ67266.1 adenylylsulfate kinase [Thiohalomonas denitrificans]